jgi:hypothetical protein
MPTDISASLSSSELTAFAKCEKTIARGISTFKDVGQALLSIRDAKLYREEHATFADYCRKKWNFSDSRARQLISAVKAAESVTDVTVSSEAVARAVNAVPVEQRQAVVDWATERADGKPLTAPAIREAAAEFLEAEPEEDEPEPDLDDEATSESQTVSIPAPPTTARGADELESFVRKWVAKHKHPVCVVAAMLENLAAKLRGES